MPCPHFNITIVQRSENQSAVSAAAYQSGEKLFSEYDQQQKYYPIKPKSSTEKSFSRPMRRRSTQTAIPYGTLPKHRKTMGCPACPEVRACHSEELPRNSMLTFSVTTAGSFCFQRDDSRFCHPRQRGRQPPCHILLTMRPMDETGNGSPRATRYTNLTKTARKSGSRPAVGKATSRIPQTGTTISTLKSGGRDGRTRPNAI